MVQHLGGFTDLSFSSIKHGNNNLISGVVHGSVFRKRNRHERMNRSDDQRKDEEQEKELRMKVIKRLNKLKFINGVESRFFNQIVNNEEKLKQFVFFYSIR